MNDVMGALAEIRADKGLETAKRYQTEWENALSDMSLFVQEFEQKSDILGLLQEVIAAKHYRLR